MPVVLSNNQPSCTHAGLVQTLENITRVCFGPSKAELWLGSYHFLPGGGRLFVMAGCQFFWSPLWPTEKKLAPPLTTPKNLWHTLCSMFPKLLSSAPYSLVILTIFASCSWLPGYFGPHSTDSLKPFPGSHYKTLTHIGHVEGNTNGKCSSFLLAWLETSFMGQ